MLKSKLNLALAAAMLLAAASLSFAQVARGDSTGREADLIAVLKSDAPQKEKADACRQLARIGTKEAVPTLAALLGDERLSHMARYALEPIPEASVDDALRDALGNLKGRLLVGVIGSLGARRDAKAVEPLAKLLSDADADVAQAAARSLGRIGTPSAAKALDGALANVPAANQLALCEGMFRCAEALAAKDQRDEAIAIYDRLRKLQAPHQVRAGALRGAVLTRRKEGLPLLLDAIRGEDYAMVAAAARVSMELPGAEVTEALAAELAKVTPDKQVLLIQTLGARGDAAAGPALLAIAGSGPVNVRLAAIRALTQLGHAPAVALLTDLSLGAEAQLAAAARLCLGSFPGKEGDAAIVSMLNHKEPKARCLAIELIGQRSIPGTAASLLKAAEDPDEAVRMASLKALRDLAGAGDLPALLNLLVKAGSAPEMEAAESALGALCARQTGPVAGNVVIQKAVYGDLPNGPSADVTKKVAEIVKAGSLSVDASNDNFGDPAQGATKRLRVDYTVNGAPASKTVNEGESVTFTASAMSPACVDALCAALAQAPTSAKLALLRVLRSAGGPKALEAVRAAATDANAEIKETAIRTLCAWPTGDAMPQVAELAKNPPSPTFKILALRGYIRLIPQQDVPAAKKLEYLRDAMALADGNDEKKLVLSALGAIALVDSLAMVTPHLDNPNLKEEACVAAVGIAEKIAQSHPAQVAQAMQRVAKVTANKKLAARANALVQQTRRP